MTTFLAFALVIVICVGIHELGHFTFAKWVGIRVDEFSIGFGPRLTSRQWGETRYSLRAIPVGGFVRMAGMLGLRGEADAGERNFYRATIPRRLLVMFAGVGFNMLLAVLCFSIVIAAPTPSTVAAGGPAYQAGLRDGDSIISIDGHVIDHSSGMAASETVQHALSASNGNPIVVRYRTAAGSAREATVRPGLDAFNASPDNPSCDPRALQEGTNFITAIDGNPVTTGDPRVLLGNPGTTVSGYSLGSVNDSPCPRTVFNNIALTGVGTTVDVSWRIGMGLDFAGRSLPGAVVGSLDEIKSFPGQTWDAIQTVASTPGSGGVIANLQGPLGIAQAAGQQVQQGALPAIAFIGYISMNLGFLNLIPIPFLDGGKIALVLLEAVRRRRLAPEREAAIYAAGLAMMMLLILYLTVGDIRRHH